MAMTAQATRFNPQNSSMFRSWCVVLTSALFFFYIFIQMNLFNAINSDLVREFHFTAQQLGHLFAFSSYGNVLFLFPAGILLDRLSTRKLLAAVFTAAIIATHIFSTASTFWLMSTARFVIGLTGAFALLSSVKLATSWFEPRHMALVVGIVVTIAMIGGTIAQTPLALLTNHFGWRYAVQLVSILGTALMLAQLFIVRDQPQPSSSNLNNISTEKQPLTAPENISFWHSLSLTVTSKQNWLSGIYISLVNLPLFILGGIWGVPYLTQVHHLTHVQATQITSMLFIGMMLGCPIAGLISDHLGLRKLPMIVGALLSIAAISAIIFAPTLPFYGEICLYFALGVVISSQVIGYPVIAESNSPSITATATSLGSILIMSAGMLAPTFGWLLELSGNSQVIDNIVVYSQADYTRANCMMLAGLVIALVASCLIKETYCKRI